MNIIFGAIWGALCWLLFAGWVMPRDKLIWPRVGVMLGVLVAVSIVITIVTESLGLMWPSASQ